MPSCRPPQFFRVYYSIGGQQGCGPVLSSEYRKRLVRDVAVLILAAAPLACVAPEPTVQNPFLGTWATPLDKDTCRGVFRFGYDTQSRQALTDLIARQPDLRKKLSELLVEPSYPVARLDCDRGDQTYVLLNDRQLVAIYRDGDIAAIDRLARR